MQTITIRIPARRAATDPFKIEWFEWNNGSLKGVRPTKKAQAPQDLLGGNPTLADLRMCLQANTASLLLHQYGRALMGSIASPKLASLWKALRPECRVYLALEDQTVRDLPWELLEDTVPIVRLTGRPLIRCFAKDLPPADPIERRPLKVLVLVGVGPNENIGARSEAARLRRLFWQVDHSFDCVVVDALQHPLGNAGDVEALLRNEDPDVFHFIGHGDRSCLKIFSNATRLTWDWDSADVAVALQNSGAPRVAYVNACRSNAAGGPLDMASIAGAFLDNGTAAVISMQADVDGKSAQSCAGQFYSQLAAGSAIDQALQSGRASLDQKTREPYLPVLTVRAAVETILPARPEVDVARERAVRDCVHLGALKTFVDRHTDRRTLVRSFLRADTADLDRYTAALIEGPSKTGKTWFCWWWIRMCAWQRLQAYYVQPPKMDDPAKINWLEYVRGICRGDGTLGSLAPSLPAEVASQFYWELEQVAQGAEPPYKDAPKGFQDRNRTLTQILDGKRAGNEVEKKILASFHDALKRAAGSERLLLVCDEWMSNFGLGSADIKVLKSSLFDPIADDRHGPVRLMITLPATSEINENPFREVSFGTSWHRVQINDFDGRNIRELLSEYVERYYLDDVQDRFSSWNPPPDPISPAQFVKDAERFATYFGLSKPQPPRGAGGRL